MHKAQGKHVVTVEHLCSRGQLHPAQNEMVKHNGSQCGFCTPGFVMSLACLYEEKRAAKNPSINRNEACLAISGNLCRCTGYQAIIDAAMAMQFSSDNSALPSDSDYALLDTDHQRQKLTEIADAPNDHDSYFQPQNVTELDSLINRLPNANLIAGGTDIMLQVTQQYEELAELIDLTEVKELASIKIDQDSITIGSSMNYSEFEILIASYSTQFAALLERLGSRQIRNAGTIGGNLANASPVADIPPILLAMDAQLCLRKSDGSERMLSIDDFYKGYKNTALSEQEYILAITLQKQCLNSFHRFYKVSKRFEDDISSVMAAIRFDIEDDIFKSVRIAFGGVAATPVRIRQAELLLTNKNIEDESALADALRVIQSALTPIDDVRASAAYRLAMASNLTRKAWLEVNGREVPQLYSDKEIVNA